jgi:hypothetical protein
MSFIRFQIGRLRHSDDVAVFIAVGFFLRVFLHVIWDFLSLVMIC